MGNPVSPEHGEPRIGGILFDARAANWIVHEVKYISAMITRSKKIGSGHAQFFFNAEGIKKRAKLTEMDLFALPCRRFHRQERD